jgi:GAF domain-containing protein
MKYPYQGLYDNFVDMTKEEKYKQLLQSASPIIDSTVDDIANMANLSRLIFDEFGFHWVGFYRVFKGRLTLGPFQGPIACTSIEMGKGVCGMTWKNKRSYIVDDVHEFDGHIACSPYSNSEIVVPCIRNGEVFAVLDVDSTTKAQFDAIDQAYLEQLVALL